MLLLVSLLYSQIYANIHYTTHLSLSGTEYKTIVSWNNLQGNQHMPTVDFLIGIISVGKKDLRCVHSCVGVCVVIHTKVITVGGTDLHWFDTPSIFPSLSLHLLSALPLSFHFLFSHLLSSHLIQCLALFH